MRAAAAAHCDGLSCGCVDYVDPTTRLQLSSPFYLNVINQGSNFNEDWPFYYTVEPTSFEAPDSSGTQLTEQQKETSVVGVEACMWSEYVWSG